MNESQLNEIYREKAGRGLKTDSLFGEIKKPTVAGFSLKI